MNTPHSLDSAKNEVVELYRALIKCWNDRSAEGMANLTARYVSFIGFDGSQMNSAEEIKTSLTQIFTHHPTAAYITLVRRVDIIAENVAMLRADVGMVPPGKDDINPAVNAIQTLIAVKEKDVWKIASFQNTPAAYHGRAEVSEALSNDLRVQLKKERVQ